MTEPMVGICKVGEYNTSIFYKAVCNCMDNDHTQDLILELDSDGVITLSINSTIWTHYTDSWCDTWYEKLGVYYKSQCYKWKQVFKLIFTGQIKGENEFLLHSEQQIQDYINALQSGLDKLKQ